MWEGTGSLGTGKAASGLWGLRLLTREEGASKMRKGFG